VKTAATVDPTKAETWEEQVTQPALALNIAIMRPTRICRAVRVLLRWQTL
jgi:hypothetical protein